MFGLVVVGRDEVATWDGTEWRTLATAEPLEWFASAAVCASGLFVAHYRPTGTFTLEFNDGTTWRTLADIGEPTRDYPSVMAIGRGGLYIARSAEGEPGLAVWKF